MDLPNYSLGVIRGIPDQWSNSKQCRTGQYSRKIFLIQIWATGVFPVTGLWHCCGPWITRYE